MVLSNKNGNVEEGIYGSLRSFYLSLGQHATRFDGEPEAMNTALMQVFCRTGFFENAVSR
jgi:hypothetical protein